MDDDRNWRRMSWGVILILLGVVFLAERIGWLPAWASGFAWWPLFVMLLAVPRLVRPRHAGHIGNGVFFVLIGVWFLFAANGWYGLQWHNSWPLALVAAGAGTVVRVLASRWLPDVHWAHREEHHE